MFRVRIVQEHHIRGMREGERGKRPAVHAGGAGNASLSQGWQDAVGLYGLTQEAARLGLTQGGATVASGHVEGAIGDSKSSDVDEDKVVEAMTQVSGEARRCWWRRRTGGLRLC